MNSANRLGLTVSIALLTACAALSLAAAQSANAPSADKPQASDSSTNANPSAKPGKKPAKNQTASTDDGPPKPGEYATEAEARAHCNGTVVWIDPDHFNHYKGSREYGRKPGAFGCVKE
jgi:hypothetical protein